RVCAHHKNSLVTPFARASLDQDTRYALFQFRAAAERKNLLINRHSIRVPVQEILKVQSTAQSPSFGEGLL
ncbi:MAG: hypothetical protein ACRD4I_04120, partial [Candidatus Angelobacter sp.]